MRLTNYLFAESAVENKGKSFFEWGSTKTSSKILRSWHFLHFQTQMFLSPKEEGTTAVNYSHHKALDNCTNLVP